MPTYPHAYKLGYMDVDGENLYVLELPRAGATRLRATRLPAFERGEEVSVDLRRVPLRIRRAAREHLSSLNYQNQPEKTA